MININKKKLLIEFQDNKCEQCHRTFFNYSNFEIHRIKRQGSYLDHRNLKVLCQDCHKKIHSNEFNHVRAK